MCLTTQALYLFLSMMPADRLDLTEGRVILRADTRPAHWVYNGEKWCTMAPQIDANYRLKPAA
ncbi:hypothetical protein [Oceanicola sp. 502str15]|uniref:hypothetical protein n=1 Tax=Oceanicola sp. 502str15 TaxID=2696061 RepID=UPI002094D24E|nr:hypothetical protein [Oceanicola sp. 502str15]MCO6382730.1 hypothetical protein [Oceanicola sp. 502str15]